MQEPSMQMIRIDGKEFDFDALPDEARKQIQSLQFVDAELTRLNAQIAVFKTARLAYVKALNQTLQTPNIIPAQSLVGDTIQLG